MGQFSSPSDVSSAERPSKGPQQKRTRVLLSCGPCRNSKLKCDRDQPCSQCSKKGQGDLCVYAPRPVRKPAAAKGMSARLKRLEGMVRGMLDEEGNAKPLQEADEAVGSAEPQIRAQVVQGQHGTTYVGATHCMAMLEDIEDLKTYFDDTGSDEDGMPSDELEGAELLLFSRGAPRTREDLIAQLPERNVVDRLITRYFALMSPSQHIIHRPTFTKTYARFWQDNSSPSLHWIAQLFVIVALGTFFSHYSAPHELESDSPVPVFDRVKHYRSCAGWALIWGKYAQPTIETLPAFQLFLETHFIFDRATQMNCYILSGVCVRLMFKMGLHRDPSKLTNITPFEGEMRRRMWNMAYQLELLVAFHMGLPSMVQGIESDTLLPRNLHEEDFGPDSTELPPERPSTDYTIMSYPINKSKILRVFGKIAQQAHALSPPSYSDVMVLDKLLQDTWAELPSFLQVRPLDECVGDASSLLIHRFGLAALYNKSRCVLHRRYLAEPIPNPEHDYSRRQCLEGATALMDYQHIIWKACQPGNILSHYGWFVSSLAVHDFLLAAMIIYLFIQSEHYIEGEMDFKWTAYQRASTPTKEELKEMMKRSHFIWSEVATTANELRKTADTLAVMLNKMGCPVESPSRGSRAKLNPSTSSSGQAQSLLFSNRAASSTDNFSHETDLFSALGLEGSTSGTGSEPTPFSVSQALDPTATMDFPGMTDAVDGTADMLDSDALWMTSVDSMDWRYVDTSFAHSHTAGSIPESAPTWMERSPGVGMDGMWNSGF